MKNSSYPNYRFPYLGSNNQIYNYIKQAIKYVYYWNREQPEKPRTNIRSLEPMNFSEFPLSGLCKFLKTKTEINLCTTWLHENGLISHAAICKDWDLAHVISQIGDGNVLDMGSSDSYILENLSLLKRNGNLYGIDLRKPDRKIHGVKYAIGDLMNTELPTEYFRYITCLSVIEHGVNLAQFVQEAERLLKPHGKLFVTYDYWYPRIQSDLKLFDLDWQPLDRLDVERLITECRHKNLFMIEEIDWNTDEAVINSDYYSPLTDLSYTFGMTVFEKR